MQTENDLSNMPDLHFLAESPHRLMFFVGASNVLLAMAWWTFWLINSRWALFDATQLAIPAGWMHALNMQYQV